MCFNVRRPLLVLLFRKHRFTHDLRALSPWFCVAFLLFPIGALPVIPDKYNPLLWLAAALCTRIGIITRCA